MALLSISNAHLAYGHVALLDGAALSFEAGDRLALIGRNGTGKSSLLKVLAGLEKLDDGLLQQQQGVRVIYVPQEPVLNAEGTVFEVVSEGVAEAKALRERYEAHAEGDDLDAIQTRIEALQGWTWEQRVDETLHRLDLDGARLVGQLSGGLKKRVALGRALVAMPDVLLLDEPTNGLDPRSQYALVELLVRLSSAGKTLITATHDLNIVPRIAARALVFSEEHTVVADGASQEILADLPLLLRVNLIHAHLHRHGEIIHAHPHVHEHDHNHAPHPPESSAASAP